VVLEVGAGGDVAGESMGGRKLGRVRIKVAEKA